MNALLEIVVGINREAARLCCIRQEPLESWIKDADGEYVPELELNSLLMAEAFLQLLATGLGALILALASAVVLGGFSTKIKKEDFWYITAIGIIQTAKVIGTISGPTVRFFVQFPAASMHCRVISTRTSREHVGEVKPQFVGEASMVLPSLFAAAPMVTAAACFLLPLIGLFGAVDGSDTDTKRGNMKPALIVFYSLVLFQATLFYLWCFVLITRSHATLRFSHKYFGIGNTNGEELVFRYITQTQDKCIEKGIFSTTNRTLVSFAAELLQSEYHSDHVSAVTVLHVLTTREDRADGAVEQVSSSEQVVGSLFKLLRLRALSPLDFDTKAETAEILTKLACNLRLTHIPGAAHSISSLLDPHPRLMKTAAQAGQQDPPAAEVTHQVICNAGRRRLFTELLRKCMGLGANEAAREPSSPGETQTRTNNTNQSGAELQSIGETQINIANSDASVPARRRLTHSIFTYHYFGRLSARLRLTSNIGGAELSSATTNTNEGGARDIPLIVHGLMILDKLASDPGNCTEICKTTDLVPKILAPLTNGLLKTIGNDPKTVQIVKASLRVVAKLTSGTGESSSKLRRELILENGRAAENIIWIMKSCEQEMTMRILAMEILTKLLTMGKPRMSDLFDPQDSSPEGKAQNALEVDPQDSPAAGKAQNALEVDRRSSEVIWEEVKTEFPDLIALMNAGRTSTEHRAVMAEFLAQICARSKTDQNRMHHLSSVSNALSTVVLEAIVTTEIADMTEIMRKFLASFLGLAVQISENLATAQAFENAVRGQPFERDRQVFCEFAEKLKEIIVEMREKSEDETCLVITKAAAKLVTWMMSIDAVYAYAHYFQQEKIVDKLENIVNAMGDLERCVVLRGDADAEETLQMLVEKVRSLVPLPPPQD